MPAHPDNMVEVCARCHPNEVQAALKSDHFTLKDEIGRTWKAFFPASPPLSIQTLKDYDTTHINSQEDAVADALKRRCLKCHPYYKGDEYDGTKRGTGCAACHLYNTNSIKLFHRFDLTVKDDRCLSCHYSNFTGSDYYGRFEKDYEEDFRAPLVHGKLPPRPYGVEWRDMQPDVHKKAGMICKDCHDKQLCDIQSQTSSMQAKPCTSCHIATSKADADKHHPPIMDTSRIGHRQEDMDKVACQVCHAVWSFQDKGRSLLCQEEPSWSDWMYLGTQGSSEVEKQVFSHAIKFGYITTEELADTTKQLLYQQSPCDEQAKMTDKLSGKEHTGLWFEGFEERGWANPLICLDKTGRLQIARPLLDLTITYQNKHGETITIGNKGVRWISYIPHTIGKADMFITTQVRLWLEGKPFAETGHFCYIF